MIVWSVICAWLGLAFATESMGLYAHEFNTALAVVLLVGSALLYPQKGEPGAERDRRLVFAGRIVALVGLLLIPSGWTIRLFGAGLWFWGLDLSARGRGHRRPAAAALAIGCVVFGVYEYLYGHSLLTWYAMQDVSRFFSTLVGHPGETSSLGPTFSGVGLLVLAAGVLAGGVIVSSQRRIIRLLVTVVSVPILYFAYLAAFVYTQPDPEAALRGSLLWWQKIQHAINPVFMPAILGVVLAIPVAWYLSAVGARAVDRGRPKLATVSAVVAMVVLSICSLTNLPAGPRADRNGDGRLRAVFYKEGFHNWLVPSKDRYGSRSGGMFGNLPVLVRCLGWEGELIPTIDENTLADADVLFIANPKDSLPQPTIDLIDRFVLDGGSLLMLGDHTWRKDGEPGMILDEAIGRTHVRFRFDSAYYFIGGWLHSMQYWPHQTTVGLRDETNESGCVVGASLDISYPATPLVVGRYGYSDRGHEQRDPHRGYMDNGMPNPGEMLGDLVLVAAENVGRGRVIVLGDTSGFVNGIQTQTWPFTSRVFRWLGSSGRATVSWWRDGLGILLLIGAGVVVLATFRSGPMILPLACATALVAGWGSHRIVQWAAKPEPLRGDVALVDLSHVGLHSLEAWRDDAISGIYLNFMREGYYAIGSKHFDEEQLRASKVFVTVAPTKPYSSGEVDVLQEYMRDGGAVLLFVGWEERAGAASLLERFKLEIPHRPQGRATEPIPGTTITPNFWAAWPVLSADPEHEPIETIASLRGDPIIVRKPIGRGQLVVIGDSKMLECRNFETEDGAIMANVQFFNWLVQNVLRREAA